MDRTSPPAEQARTAGWSIAREDLQITREIRLVLELRGPLRGSAGRSRACSGHRGSETARVGLESVAALAAATASATPPGTLSRSAGAGLWTVGCATAGPTDTFRPLRRIAGEDVPKRALDPASGCRATWLLVPAVALTLLLTACSDGDGIQVSEPRSGSTSGRTTTDPSSAATSDSAVQREVTDRYVTFQRVVAETGAASNANDPRLAEYATGAVLENLRGKFAVRQQAGTRLYGVPVPHVQSVSVAGDRATLLDCLDNSATGLMDRSGKKLSVGRERQETTATLVREGDAWKVSEITTIAGGGSC